MARRFGSLVTKLYVARPPEGMSDLAVLQHHFLTAAEEMRGSLTGYQTELFEGIETESILEVGHPVATIVDLARRLSPGIIMMPTRGYSPFRQLLLGSVTSGVLHDAECPVWTCAHADDDVAIPTSYKSIVCAVDLGAASGAVLAAATELASAFGASFHPLCVRDAEAPAEGERQPLASSVEVIHAANVAAGVVIAEERYQADLLVIGRGKAQGVLGRLRTNAHDLIRYSRCPVLSV